MEWKRQFPLIKSPECTCVTANFFINACHRTAVTVARGILKNAQGFPGRRATFFYSCVCYTVDSKFIMLGKISFRGGVN